MKQKRLKLASGIIVQTINPEKPVQKPDQKAVDSLERFLFEGNTYITKEQVDLVKKIYVNSMASTLNKLKALFADYSSRLDGD